MTKPKAGKLASLPGLVLWHSQLVNTMLEPKPSNERKQ